MKTFNEPQMCGRPIGLEKIIARTIVKIGYFRKYPKNQKLFEYHSFSGDFKDGHSERYMFRFWRIGIGVIKK